MGDAVAYDAWAREIAGGDWLGHEVFFQAPLYPYFMATVYSLFARSPLVLKLVQLLIGATSCVLLARAGRSFFSRETGLLAGALLAIYPVAVFYDGAIQKSVLDSFFVCALLAIAGRLRERAAGRWWFMAGVALGLFALTRENALVFLPVLLVWLWVAWRREARRNRLRWTGFLWLGLMVPLLPVAWRNHSLGGGLQPTTSQFGYNFYLGNNRNADGFFNALIWGHANVKFEKSDAVALAEQAAGRALSPGEVSHYWTMRTVSDIRESPARWLRLLGRKWLLVWNVAEVGDTDDPCTYGEWSPLLRMLFRVFHFGVLVPLAMLGVCLTWPRRGELWLLHAMTLAFAASVSVFCLYSRYRFPLAPFLLLFMSAGLANLVLSVREKLVSRIFLGAVVATAAALICNRAMVNADETRGVTHYNIAVNLVAQQGDLERAIRHYAESVRLKPDFAVAHHNLGALLTAQGRMDEAIPELRAALRLRPDYPEAESNLGAALAGQGKLDEALTHFAAAVRLDPDYADAHCNLAVLLAKQGNIAEAISHAQAAVKLNPQSERYLAALEALQKMESAKEPR